MKDHHFKCNLCEIVPKNKEDLTLYTEREHATFNCNIFKKAVEVTKVVDRMNMHNTKDRFNQVLSEAPPKKNAVNPKGWTLFLKEKKVELRRINPAIKHTEVTVQVSSMWKTLSKSEQHIGT